MSLPESLPDIPNRWIDSNLSKLKDFCESRQPLPDMNDFEVSELAMGVRFKLRESAVKSIVANENFPLKIIDASTTSLAKVRVVLGYVAGFKADSGMTAGSDSPVFLKTLASAATHYIYADVTVAYSATVGVWQATACAVSTATSFPSSTSTHAYVLIGSAVVATTSGGLGVTSVTNAIIGSQSFQRIGNATTYVDYNQNQ